MKKIFEMRGEALFQDGPVAVMSIPNNKVIGTTFPFAAKITLFDDRLLVKLPMQEDQTLMFDEIDSINKKWIFTQAQVMHHSGVVKLYVFLRGWFIFKRLSKAIRDNNLNVKIVG